MDEASPLLMPKLGLTMTEGIIASWSVQVGSTVRAGDVLFTVETDKIATDVEARGDGVILSIELNEGERALVGQRIGSWTGPSSDDVEVGDTRPALPSEGFHADLQVALSSPSAIPRRIMASPAARRLAAQNGIDIKSVSGSGPRGRIIIRDVTYPGPSSVSEPPALSDVTYAGPPTEVASSAQISTKRPATNIEKIIAKRLLQSKQTIPHFYVQACVDISELIELRRRLNVDPQYPNRISINHFIIAATARALARIPKSNAIWDNEEVVTFTSSDVGMAVDTDRGLVLPIVRDAARLGLDALASECSILVAKAREGRLKPADSQGGAVSVSNVGMFGAAALIPIINPGQSAIVGVGAPSGVFRPNAAEQPVLRQELNVTMSCDHRVWNGVDAAKFLNAVRLLLEKPLSLLRG